MIIPLLGPRDAQEFVYMGDAALMIRPDGMVEGAEAAFITTNTRATIQPGSAANCGSTNRGIGHGWSSRATRSRMTHIGRTGPRLRFWRKACGW